MTFHFPEIPILRRFGLSRLGPCRDQHPVQNGEYYFKKYVNKIINMKLAIKNY